MEHKGIFLRLKNGKSITIYYKKDLVDHHTIELNYKDEMFIVHSYIFDGDDVLDENNYRDQLTKEYSNFNELINFLIEKYPGIKFPV